MDYEIEISRIQNEITKIEFEIKNIFSYDFANHKIPDILPPKWSVSKFKIFISFDFLDENNIKSAFDKISSLVIRRNELRRIQAGHLKSMQINKITNMQEPE